MTSLSAMSTLPSRMQSYNTVLTARTLRNVGSRVQKVAEGSGESHPTNQQVPGQQPNTGANREAPPKKKVGAVWIPQRTKTRSEKRKEEKEEVKLTGCH